MEPSIAVMVPCVHVGGSYSSVKFLITTFLQPLTLNACICLLQITVDPLKSITTSCRSLNEIGDEVAEKSIKYSPCGMLIDDCPAWDSNTARRSCISSAETLTDDNRQIRDMALIDFIMVVGFRQNYA